MAIPRLFLRKKKKKPESANQKLKKFIGAEISAESAIVATGKVLVESMEIAKNKNDVMLFDIIKEKDKDEFVDMENMFYDKINNN